MEIVENYSNMDVYNVSCKAISESTANCDMQSEVALR